MRFSGYQPRMTIHAHELSDGLINDFVANAPKVDLITEYEEFIVDDITLAEFAQFIQTSMGGQDVAGITGYQSSLVTVESPDMLVIVTNDDQSQGRSTEKLIRTTLTVTAIGQIEAIKALFQTIEDRFSRKTYTSLSWWYTTTQGVDSMSMALNTTDKLFDEYYPWFEQGQAKYFDEFLESSAPLLFISGPPGTGKTSFIRNNIARHNMNAYVGYDPALFTRDDMFISFLGSRRDHCMILEDAEAIVLPRDTGGNSMMARFLNVSDGLLKDVKKKFIFTTNETNFEKIDDALIRPGRCFDYVEFRPLNFNEAVAAAKAGGLPVPTVVKEYTLAELFNQRKRNTPGHKFGFKAA